MARRPRPWYRSDRDTWVVILDGVWHTLAYGPEAREAAWTAFHRLMAARASPRKTPLAPPSVAEVVVAYLAHLAARRDAGELAPDSWEDADRRTRDFATAFGRLAADQIEATAVERWLLSRPGWGPTSRHDAASAVRAIFRWAVRAGLLERDPLAAIRIPSRRQRRQHVMSPADWPRVLGAVRSAEFRRLLELCHACGCRPGEAARIEARHLDRQRGVAVLPGKQTRRTGRESVLVLPATILAWLWPLADQRPTGPLLRTATGRPWCKDSINCQMRAIRRRLGVGQWWHCRTPPLE